MTILAQIWRLLDRAQRRQLILLQLLALLMALSAVAGVAAVVPFFAVLADPHLVDSNVVLHALYQHLPFTAKGSFVIVLGGAFAALTLLANAVNLFGMLAINRFALRVGDTFFIRLFAEYLGRDYGFHLRSNSAALASKLLSDTERVSNGILRQGLVLVSNLVTIGFIMASIVLVNRLVAVVATVGLGAAYAALYAGTRGLLLRNGRSQSRYHAERAQVVSESFGAIREVIIQNVGYFFVQKFAGYCRLLARIELTTLAISRAPRNVLECAVVFCLVGAAAYLRSESGGNEGLGPWLAQLSFIGLAAYRLMPAFQQTFDAIVTIRANHLAFEGIAAELERAPGARAVGGEEPSAALPRPAPSWGGKPSREIRLRDVSFGYAADRPPALSNLSLCITAGAAVGFVGTNGSGKTTLVDVLAGLLIPTSGHVEVDGIVLDEAHRRAWQASIAYVPQHVYLLDATFAENIAVGIPSGSIDRDRLDSVVELTRLTDCLASLPNGYGEMLGDRGCRLSGGQRQRVGIARALYRDASVLILDEATSALDNVAEEEIVATLDALRPSRTLLLIAHRLSALRHCDIIHEIRNGRVVRSGTFADLHPATRAQTIAW